MQCFLGGTLSGTKLDFSRFIGLTCLNLLFKQTHEYDDDGFVFSSTLKEQFTQKFSLNLNSEMCRSAAKHSHFQ